MLKQDDVCVGLSWSSSPWRLVVFGRKDMHTLANSATTPSSLSKNIKPHSFENNRCFCIIPSTSSLTRRLQGLEAWVVSLLAENTHRTDTPAYCHAMRRSYLCHKYILCDLHPNSIICPCSARTRAQSRTCTRELAKLCLHVLYRIQSLTSSGKMFAVHQK